MIVLDCGAALSIALGVPEGKGLASLLLEGERCIAPALLRHELAHTLAEYVRGGYLDERTALDLGADALALVDEFVEDADVWREVVAESRHFDCSSNALHYVVLARRKGATLLTLDGDLQRACLANGVNCVFEDEGL